MWKHALFVLILFITCSCTATFEDLKDNYYNEYGIYQGYSIKTDKGITKYYDETGKYIGFSRQVKK